MSDLQASLRVLARTTFCTKADQFVREAVIDYLANADWRYLAPSQWGSIRAILVRHGAVGQPETGLLKHFDGQRKKAEKKERGGEAAAYQALSDEVQRVKSLVREMFEDAALDHKSHWGESFSEENFQIALEQEALVYFFRDLVRLARLHEGKMLKGPELLKEFDHVFKTD